MNRSEANRIDSTSNVDLQKLSYLLSGTNSWCIRPHRVNMVKPSN